MPPRNLDTDIRELSAIVAYAAGVPEKFLTNASSAVSLFSLDLLRGDNDLKELHTLCGIRSDVLKNIPHLIEKYGRSCVENDHVLNCIYFSSPQYKYLVDLTKTQSTSWSALNLLSYVCSEIEKRATTLERFIFDEPHSDWVLDLLIYRGKCDYDAILGLASDYVANMSLYPFGIWVNSSKRDRFMFKSDYRMMFNIYQSHGEMLVEYDRYKYKANRRVSVDYSKLPREFSAKETIREMLEARNTAVVVDTQNIPAVWAFNFLNWMYSECPESVSVVVLFTDGTEDIRWCCAEKTIPFEVQKIEVGRVKRNKSAVDPALMSYVFQQYYENGRDNFFVFSSDCDFFTLPALLPKVNFCFCGLSQTTGSDGFKYVKGLSNAYFVVIDDFLRAVNAFGAGKIPDFLPPIVEKINEQSISADKMVRCVAKACSLNKSDISAGKVVFLLNNILSFYDIMVTDDGCFKLVTSKKH